MVRLSSLCLVFAVVLSGCPEEKKDDGPAKTDPKKEEPVAKTDEPATDEPAAVADEGASHPECVGPLTDKPEETFEVGGKKFVRKGAVLTIEGEDADDEFVLGQLTDVKDFTPENRANVKVAIDWMVKGEKVDAIVITGDLGEKPESIEGVVNMVAETGVPVMAIAGNRECRAHFTTALKAAQAKHKNVINMNVVRVVNTDDVSIVSLPGYYNKSYIHCAEGCEYTPADVAALSAIAKKTTAPARVLVSHGPPKMKGPTGLDRIHEDVNVGDPELTKLLEKGEFPFGLFGNIQEAGGYATDLSGENRIKQDVYADSLYLNPGPIDAVRWAMLDGTESLGMAGVLKVKGKQAAYKIYRLRPGEAKVEN